MRQLYGGATTRLPSLCTRGILTAPFPAGEIVSCDLIHPVRKATSPLLSSAQEPLGSSAS
jgi:hypothetical protein